MKNLRSLFITQFLGAFNDNVFKNALVIIIIFQNMQFMGIGSTTLVALSGGLFILPFFLFSGLSGELADHLQKATLIKWIKFIEIIVMLLACLGFYLNSVNILLVALFLMGLQSTFFGPIKYGALPDIVEENKLVHANALISSSTFIAILIGTIFGGFLASAHLSVLMGSIIVIAILGFIASLIQRPLVRHHTLQRPVNFNIFQSTWQLLKKNTKNRELSLVLLGVSWFWFLGSGILTLLPNLAKSYAGGNEQVATFFLALFTIGMGLGSFFCSKISRDKAEMGLPAPATILMAFAMIATSITFYFISQTQYITPRGLIEFLSDPLSICSSICLLFVSFLGGLYIIPHMTRLQELAPKGHTASVISANNILNAIFMVASAVMIMGLSILGLDDLSLFLVLATLNLIVSFVLYSIYMELSVQQVFGYFITASMYRLKIKDNGIQIPENEPLIIMSNHQSFVDWLVLMRISPRPIRFIIDHAYYYHWFLNFWLKMARLIPIAPRKESMEVYEKAFDIIERDLNNNAILGLFPEGALTKDGNLRAFQPGINKILGKRPTKVVAVKLSGLWPSFFSHSGKGPISGPISFRPEIQVEYLACFNENEFDLKKAQSLYKNSALKD